MSDTCTATAQRRAILLMLICSVLWSIGGIFIKLIPWHPFAISGWRSLLAGICMAIYMRRFRLRLRFNRYSLTGGLALATTLLGFVVANKLTTAANAIVLQFTSPIFILLLSSAVLHQRITKRDVTVVAITSVGIALFFFDQMSTDGLTGNIIALCSGFLIAIMFLATGAADEDSRMSGILIGHLLCALIGAPVIFFTETALTPIAIGSIFVLGIVQLGIPYILFGMAIRDCPPLMCSLLGAVEPLLSPVWVFLFTGERPGLFALCGGAIVIVTITIWCVSRRSGSVTE